ncbi:peptidylprolyl isomerase, partial [Candidatus Sumerlaeota bacterium]|nr:peptidylprolyl isomerase [Candidatus Sumerlaeota bacterium]
MRTFLIALLTTTCPLVACGQPPETVAQHTYPCGVSISEGMVEAFLSEPDLWDPGERLSDFGISREEMATRAGAVLLALTEEAEAEGLIDDPSLLNRLDHLRWELRREMLYSALQASCEVTEEEIQALYEEERDRLHQPEERRLWSILIEAGLNPTEADWEAARSRGMEALRRLRGGESFGAVAHDLGEGPSAENGGDFGPVGPSNLPESTRDLIWALPEGEISDLVRLAMGYAIFRTTDWRDEGPTPLQRVR